MIILPLQSNATDFYNTLTANGLIPREIIADGEIYRCGTLDKPRSDNGWYRLNLDGRGYYGVWHTGFKADYFPNNPDQHRHTTSSAERIAIAAARLEREAERQIKHTTAAQRAATIYAAAQPVKSHRYLTQKGVAACSGVKLAGSRLVIPVYSPLGELQSLQFIDEKGGKRFFTGGAMGGGWFGVGFSTIVESPVVWLAEGYATAATLHAATNEPVIVAFNAGNLPAVAEMIRTRWPSSELRIMSDNDQNGTGQAAAEKTGAAIWMPPTTGTDFNDWRDSLPASWLTEWQLRNNSVTAIKSAPLEVLPPTTTITLTNGTEFKLSTLRGRKLNSQMVTLADGRTGKLNMGSRDKSQWHIVTTGGAIMLDTTPEQYKGEAAKPERVVSRYDVGKAVARLARETAEKGGATVLTVDGGAGKSRGINRIDEALKLLIALPNLELAEQHAAGLARQGDTVEIYRGRGQVVDGVAMCQRWEEWRALPIPEWSKSGALCRKIRIENGEADCCPHYGSCPYIQQRERLAQATMVLGAHNYLKLGIEGYRPDLVIADESVIALLSGSHDSATLEDFSGDMLAMVARVKGELQQGKRAILTDEERQRAAEWLKQQRGGFNGTIETGGQVVAIWPSMSPSALKQALEELKAAGSGSVNHSAAGLVRALLRGELNGVWLGKNGAIYYLTEKPEYAIKSHDPERAERLAAKRQRVIEAAPAKLAAIEARLQAASGQEAERLTRKRARLLNALERAESPRKREILKPAPLLVLDGTGRESLYRPLLGESMRYEHWRVRDAEPVRVIRYAGRSWNAASWQNQNDEGNPNGEVAAGYGGWVAAMQKLTGYGVVGSKRLMAAAVTAGAPAERVGWFGKVRGLNRFESLEGVIIVGRDEPNPIDVEAQARAIWRNEPLQLSGEWQRQLTSFGTEINGHADPRVAQLLASLRDDEITQTAWRTRHVWQAGKTVVIVGTTPCPRFDELAEIRSDSELPPVVLGRLVEAAGSLEAVPVGAAYAAQVLATEGMSQSAIEKAGKRAATEVTRWVEQGGQSLNNTLNKPMSPLLAYRIKGQSGTARQALVLGTTVDRARAERLLTKVHSAAVTLAEPQPLPPPTAEPLPRHRDPSFLLYAARIAIDTRGDYQRAVAAKSWLFRNLEGAEIQRWFEAARSRAPQSATVGGGGV